MERMRLLVLAALAVSSRDLAPRPRRLATPRPGPAARTTIMSTGCERKLTEDTLINCLWAWSYGCGNARVAASAAPCRVRPTTGYGQKSASGAVKDPVPPALR